MAQNSKSKRGAHLTPFRWPKGKSGNPGGRPKSKLLSEAYKNVLEAENKNGETGAEQVAKKMLAEAKAGKVNAAAELADRVEGKPRQAYEVKLSITDELADRMEKARKRLKK